MRAPWNCLCDYETVDLAPTGDGSVSSQLHQNPALTIRSALGGRKLRLNTSPGAGMRANP